MSQELDSLIDYVKKNIPSAEILKVAHTERIFNQNKDECDSHPTKEGILVLLKR